MTRENGVLPLGTPPFAARRSSIPFGVFAARMRPGHGGIRDIRPIRSDPYIPFADGSPAERGAARHEPSVGAECGRSQSWIGLQPQLQ